MRTRLSEAGKTQTQWNGNYRVKGAASRHFKAVVTHLGEGWAVSLEQGKNEIGQDVWQIWAEQAA